MNLLKKIITLSLCAAIMTDAMCYACSGNERGNLDQYDSTQSNMQTLPQMTKSCNRGPKVQLPPIQKLAFPASDEDVQHFFQELQLSRFIPGPKYLQDIAFKRRIVLRKLGRDVDWNYKNSPIFEMLNGYFLLKGVKNTQIN